MEIGKNVLGEDHFNLVDVYMNIAAVYEKIGELDNSL